MPPDAKTPDPVAAALAQRAVDDANALAWYQHHERTNPMAAGAFYAEHSQAIERARIAAAPAAADAEQQAAQQREAARAASPEWKEWQRLRHANPMAASLYYLAHQTAIAPLNR